MARLFEDSQRVLVVDDDPEILELLADVLQKHGLEVTTVTNGVAMDEALASEQYDLVVLDLMLPGEDGLSIAKRLKQTTSLPVIMLTALSDDIDKVVGLEIGADDYVAKPFNPRVLLARIRSVLRRKKTSRTSAVDATPRILVVDDDHDTLDLLSDYFAQQGFEVQTVENGAGMDAALARTVFDLVILDLKMPGEDGQQLSARIRRQSDIPIIMMTALGDDIEQVVGLEMGADDYIYKPPNPRELLARVKAVLRRDQIQELPPEVDGIFYFGDYILDVNNLKLVKKTGENVAITSSEFELLHVLAQHSYETLDRDSLLELLSERSKSRIDRSIDVRVTRLRSKIERDPSNPTLIKTVWGKGYVFCPNET